MFTSLALMEVFCGKPKGFQPILGALWVTVVGVLEKV